MNKVFFKQTAAALVMALVATAGCRKNDPVKVSGVKLSETVITLNVGESKPLVATVTPADAENKAITWSSNDADVATVDQNGKVTALKAGTAVVGVTAADGNYTATCAVRVLAPMTMTSAKKEMGVYLAGSGVAVIDWGDGSTPDTVEVSAEMNLAVDPSRWHTHTFSDTEPHNIVINGQNIIYMNCGGMQLTDIDVSRNTALAQLWCGYNLLTSLDLSKNTALQGLGCNNNQLTSLDVSNCTALSYLNCTNNLLTALDVSKNTVLSYMECSANRLTSLDVSGCNALSDLYCNKNKLSAEGLNALFGTLRRSYGNHIIIIDNPGSGDCDRTIAIGKGWIVI